MRIIAGKFGGVRLRAPAGSSVRPTSGRVREALFSILGDEILEASVLDLFAGSGAVGIEALSRGAAHATFVESGRSVTETLRRNLETVDCMAQARILTADVFRGIRQLGEAAGSFGIVYADPPYQFTKYPKLVRALGEAEILGPAARIILEHASRDDPELPNGFVVERCDIYGDAALSFLSSDSSA